MFPNNSNNSQIDNKNKNPADITIFNESIFASVSATSNVVDQESYDQKEMQLNLYNIFSI